LIFRRREEDLYKVEAADISAAFFIIFMANQHARERIESNW